MENITEEVTQDISASSDLQSDLVEISEDVHTVPEEVPEVVLEQTEPVLENLLKELIEQKISEGENEKTEQSTDNNDTGDSDNISLLSNSNETDYTQLLEDILSASQDLLTSANQANDNYDVYMQNNDINADINNISLTNYLLLLLFIALLFNAALNFARRIF